MSLFNKIHQMAFENCQPISTTLEITLSCNLKCKHCYNFDRASKIPKSLYDNKLTEIEILDLIDQIAELGGLYLNFSGGEALLHPSFFDFLKKARENNLEARLKTNGVLLNETMCQKLKNQGLKAFDISLYGFSEDSYFNFTRVHNSFKKVLNGIIAAKKSSIPLSISMIIHRDNFDELDQMINFCKEYQIEFNIGTEITDRYDGSKGAKLYEITSSQIAEALRGKHAHYFDHYKGERAYQCACARSVCGITSTGDVYPCLGAPLVCGNVRKKSLRDIWENSRELNTIRNLKQSSFDECEKCDLALMCDRNSGTSYINTGNYTGCDSSSLKRAKERSNLRSSFSL